MLECPQESFLSRIFCKLRLTQHAVAEIVDMRLVGFDQFGESFFIALLGLDHPGHFIVHAFSLDFLLSLREKTKKVAWFFVGELYHKD